MTTHVRRTTEVPTGTAARILKLDGTYDADDVRHASLIALDIIRDGCRDLLLDLRRAEITTAGLILLVVRPAHWMSRRNGLLRLRVPPGRALETTGIAESVEIERVDASG